MLNIIGICHDFLLKVFCLTVTKKLVGEPIYVSESFWCQIFLDSRIITILSKFSLSHSIETFRGRTLYCFTNFGYRKVLSILEVYHDFLLKFFCLALPKKFVEEPFCVSQTFWYHFFSGINDNIITILSKTFCLTLPKFSRANTLVFL